MKQKYTFHKSVRGHLHIMREIPCEDYSDSYADAKGRYYIAIVADGHGAAECFRSSVGSEQATRIAMSCLRELAESVLESEESEKKFCEGLCSNPRSRQSTIRRLTDTIIAKWHDSINEDYKNNPPTQEEMSAYLEKYKEKAEEHIPHIYGTTLMAALQLSGCLLLLHQGDGRCDVFYADGSVDQPIPWDARCEDTAVTSMCDSDATDSIRSCVIDLTEKEVIACYLGCDGVEDAYRDTYENLGDTHVLMGGVHTFYKDLTCQLDELGPDTFETNIGQMLSEFSAVGRFSNSGSGDDVSVAAIVDLKAIKKVVEQFALDVKRYELEENLFWKEEELRGKLRKHDILKKRMCAAENEVLKFDDYLKKLESQKNELEKKISDEYQKKRRDYAISLQNAKQNFEEAKILFEEYDAKYQEIKEESQKIRIEIQQLAVNQEKSIVEEKVEVQEEKKKWIFF